MLFGQVWTRPDLSPKERSLITVACLTTSGNTEQLVFHLDHARRNGATESELIEAITPLAFYAGWPKAMSAFASAGSAPPGVKTETDETVLKTTWCGRTPSTNAFSACSVSRAFVQIVSGEDIL